MIIRFLLCLLCISSARAQAEGMLQQWNDNAAKHRIIKFIKATANPQSEHFVVKENRIAVFDNDGTLWTERPYYFQLMFLVDKIKTMADKAPELKKQQPFKAIIENDKKTIAQFSKNDLLKLIAKTHSGMTPETFQKQVKLWLESKNHPELQCKLTKLTYLPMKEFLKVLKQYDYTVYIVTGGGTDFVRSVSKELYGIPVDKVIGSQISTKLKTSQDGLTIIKSEEVDYINDNEVKPLNIQRIIGKRPIIAVGNSDGDLPMLQYTSQGKTHLVVLVWHTDKEREYAYDKNSKVGHLDKALKQAKEHNWLIVNMKKDWKHIYSDQSCKRNN